MNLPLARRERLRVLDLEEPDERRLVLLPERDDVEDAKPLAGADVDLVASLIIYAVSFPRSVGDS